MQASQLPLKGTTTAHWQGFAALLARVTLRLGYLPLEPGRVLAHQGSYVLFNFIGAIDPAANRTGLIKHGPLDWPKLGRHLFTVLLFQPLSAALLPLGSGFLILAVTRHD